MQIKHLEVACAIIELGGKVLCTQRSASMSLPLKWEFPGGKINNGESPDECLKRELHEELGIDVSVGQALPATTHQYPSFSVTLYPFLCKIISGEIILREHSAMVWLPIKELHALDWAEADLPVIKVIEAYRKSWLKRAYYSATIDAFLKTSPAAIIGHLTIGSYTVEQAQTHAWQEEIGILRETLNSYEGNIYFEYDIPRMGRRIDVVLLIGPVIFVLEFKTGEKEFAAHAIDQVWDYALDLKNFHESSHEHYMAPVLIATAADTVPSIGELTPQDDKLLPPIRTNGHNLKSVIDSVLSFADGNKIDPLQWEQGRYSPTPTIIEAAMALYNNHTVANISRNDAGAINLSQTSAAVADIIRASMKKSKKAICFVTGVPGAGKTLIGLDVATKHINKHDNLYSVFLSGNALCVNIAETPSLR